MSYEGGVTPSDMMQDIMPKSGNTWFWAKELSAHGGAGKKPSRDTVPSKVENKISNTSQTANLCSEGCM